MDPKLIKKIEKLSREGRKEVIKTWARDSDVAPEMVGHTLAIHKGKGFEEVFINEAMVGHKLGEFAPTRKFVSHSKKGYKKPAEGKK